jgi:hypothetical protein
MRIGRVEYEKTVWKSLLDGTPGWKVKNFRSARAVSHDLSFVKDRVFHTRFNPFSTRLRRVPIR